MVVWLCGCVVVWLWWGGAGSELYTIDDVTTETSTRRPPDVPMLVATGLSSLK